jgi:hypothetical protein
MIIHAAKHLAILLLAFTSLVAGVCPCALMNQAAVAPGRKVMACCMKNVRSSDAPVQNQDDTSCQKCCAARRSAMASGAQVEIPAPQLCLLYVQPVFDFINCAPRLESNAPRSSERCLGSPQSLLRLHCALLI